MAKRVTMASVDGVRGFQAGQNPGTFVCYACKKRTWKSRGGCGLCEACYEMAGTENSHSDGHHEDEPASDCWQCCPETAPTPPWVKLVDGKLVDDRRTS